MKVIFSMVVVLFFCLSAISGLSGNGIQKPKAIANPKADSIQVKKVDSIPNYSITINGQSNAVSITNDNPTGKKLVTVGNPSKTSNAIDINGEGNSVMINQNKNAGKVNVQQNGTGIRVNVSQSKPEK